MGRAVQYPGSVPSVDWGEVAQESVFAVRVSARWNAARTLHSDGLVEVGLRPGSRVSARVDEGGVFLHVDPDLHVDLRGPLPDFRVDTAAYRFHDARFDVEAPGLGGAVLERIAEGWLNAKVRPQLPASLRHRDYSPRTDPGLGATVRGVAAMLPLDGSGGDGRAGADATQLEGATDLGAHLTLETRRDIAVPAPGLDDLEVHLAPGTRLFVDVDTHGRADDPRLTEIVVRADDGGVVIRNTTPGVRGLLENIDVRRMSIQPGPTLRFEYVLLLERLADAATLTARLADTLAGRYTPGVAGPARIDFIRPNIDRMLAEAVGGLPADLLSEYDDVVPGLSLRQVFA